MWLTAGDNNIFTQIGLIVLVGLSAKNAILIVEFARELEFAGRTPVQAAIEASRLRLRPILMTSFAFIMGVVPLVASTGAGAEMRHAMGVAVFAGMIGVTMFGIFLTPVFYVLLRQVSGNRSSNSMVKRNRGASWRRLRNEQSEATALTRIGLADPQQTDDAPSHRAALVREPFRDQARACRDQARAGAAGRRPRGHT